MQRWSRILWIVFKEHAKYKHKNSRLYLPTVNVQHIHLDTPIFCSIANTHKGRHPYICASRWKWVEIQRTLNWAVRIREMSVCISRSDFDEIFTRLQHTHTYKQFDIGAKRERLNVNIYSPVYLWRRTIETPPRVHSY